MLNPDELKKLAELCGYKFELVNTCPCIWDEKLDRWQDWHPDTSIEQAFMVADKAFGWYKIERFLQDDAKWAYSCHGAYFKNNDAFIIDDGFNGDYDNSNLALVLCRAALTALKED